MQFPSLSGNIILLYSPLKKHNISYGQFPRRTVVHRGQIRTPLDSGGHRRSPTHNFRHGQFCVRQCPRRTLFDEQSVEQNRSPLRTNLCPPVSTADFDLADTGGLQICPRRTTVRRGNCPVMPVAFGSWHNVSYSHTVIKLNAIPFV